MAELREAAHPAWRMLDVLVYLPLSIWFLSFWIFVVTLDRGPQSCTTSTREAAMPPTSIVGMCYSARFSSLYIPERCSFRSDSSLWRSAAVRLFGSVPDAARDRDPSRCGVLSCGYVTATTSGFRAKGPASSKRSVALLPPGEVWNQIHSQRVQGPRRDEF
jgi:hypothetical protein